MISSFILITSFVSFSQLFNLKIKSNLIYFKKVFDDDYYESGKVQRTSFKWHDVVFLGFFNPYVYFYNLQSMDWVEFSKCNFQNLNKFKSILNNKFGKSLFFVFKTDKKLFDNFKLVNRLLFCFLVYATFIFSCLKENIEKNAYYLAKENQLPYNRVSFFSRLTFWWLTK